LNLGYLFGNLEEKEKGGQKKSPPFSGKSQTPLDISEALWDNIPSWQSKRIRNWKID